MKIVRALPQILSLVCFLVGAAFYFAATKGLEAENPLLIEPSRIIDSSNNRFPELYEVGKNLFIFSQKIVPNGDKSSITIEARVSVDQGHTWLRPQAISSVIALDAATVPKLYSVAMGKNGTVYCSFIKDEETISTVQISYSGELQSSKLDDISMKGNSLINPQIYMKQDGSLVLYAFTGDSTNLYIVSSRSKNGRDWSPFADFQKPNGVPVLNMSWAEVGGREIVVFQKNDFNVRAPGAATSTNQLFVTASGDKGANWSTPLELSNFKDEDVETNPLLIHNTRPRLTLVDGTLYLVWERNDTKTQPKVMIAKLNLTSLALEDKTYVTKSKTGSFNPVLFKLGSKLAITWFQSNGKISRVGISTKDSDGWSDDQVLSLAGEYAAYPSPLYSNKKLYISYHTRKAEDDKESKLAYIEPDQTALAPDIASADVVDGRKTKKSTISFIVSPKIDASGIVGYSYVVDQKDNTEPKASVMVSKPQDIPFFQSTADGRYFIHVRALDAAGNWSKAGHFSFIVDTTPPQLASINPLPLKANGLPESNTFTQSWEARQDSDQLSYRYAFTYFGEVEIASVPPLDSNSLLQVSNFVGGNQSFARVNVENGLYLLSIWAIDSVGNVSEPVTSWLRFDRYRPSTQVFALELDEDLLGDRYLSIVGRGYLSEGQVDRVILSKTKTEPYEYEFLASKNEFKITGDRRIEGLVFSHIATGTYYLGLYHTGRGLSFTDKKLDFPGQGAVKFGDFSLEKPRYRIDEPNSLYKLEFRVVIIYLIMGFAVIVILFSLRKLRHIAQESKMIETASQSLLLGLPLERIMSKKEVLAMKQKGLSLRIKFTLFFLALVIAVVALVALPLSNYTIQNQRTVLTKGLIDRVNVMIDSLVSGASKSLVTPDAEFINLSNLVQQGEALDEAEYVTITAKEKNKGPALDIIWATSDEELKRTEGSPSIVPTAIYDQFPVTHRKINKFPFIEGQTTIEDELTKILPEIIEKSDKTAREKIGDLPKQFDDAEAELNTLGKLTKLSAEQQGRIKDLGKIQTAVNLRLNAIYHEVSNPTRSIPEFDVANYDVSKTRYLFYRPVIFRNLGEDLNSAQYYQGMVRIGINTESISKAIAATQTEILTNVAIFAAIAFGAGLLGAFILSSIIIIPIKKLVAAVEHIRDTQDKEELKEYTAGIGTKDELNTLSDIIDQMAHGLAKAAASNKELLVGKDVQKMFIPLEPHGSGKATIGRKDTKHSELFGYYEGAKGVSGDYFTHLEIKPGVLALIKCDVSGKGVPAALIMVQVATLFLDYFENWEQKSLEKIKIQRALGAKNPNGNPELDVLTLHINDLVAEMGFVGRFAAFNMVLIDEKSGHVTFCNAGDNIVQIYRKARAEVEIVKLFKSPASGTFSSKIMPVQFRQELNQLESGDILVLATDGIEESKFVNLNSKWEPEPITQDDIDSGRVSSDEKVGSEDDELGGDRVTEVLNACARKEKFSFKHLKDPRNETIDFDFSGLGDNAEDVIMGLICVEKIWRLKRDPSAGPEDIVQVDKHVDKYLQKTLVQYRQIFSHRIEEDPHSLYVKFSHLKEFDQYDDLTVLALRKK